MPNPDTGMDKILRKRYLLALSIVACLVLLSQLAIQLSISKNEDDSRIVNIAGRQRMLSQRITKCALGMYVTEDPVARAGYLSELKRSIGLWEVSHKGLQQGNPELGLPGDNSEAIRYLFARIQERYRKILGAAGNVVSLEAGKDGDGARIKDEIRTIMDNEGEFLEGMDAIVFQYDREAKAKVRMVRQIEICLAIITLLALAMEALFIFRPAEFLIMDTISRQRELERQLHQSQKMEAMGQLAGGIAHDFNNLLTGIIGNISLCRVLAEPGRDKLKERLLSAESAADRARELTQRILTFSRGGAPVRKTVSLAKLLRECSSLALCGSKSSCEYLLPDDLWPVLADDGQICQVFGNLVINAHQAMPDGGRISVRCENVLFSDEDAPSGLKGRFVKTSVTDEGAGIPEEIRARIFDPFFTTKEKGRGLGLAISYSIINNHQGLIDIDTEEGRGTTVTVFLPASDAAAASVAGEKEEPVTGRGRVLVMDDEEIIRETARELLGHIGYTVELAPDGDRALQAYEAARKSGNPFDAVIMDLTIPGGMGGKEAVRLLRQADPGARVIVSSGYSSDPIMANFRDFGFDEVVSKPYNLGELSRKLYEVITAG